MVALNRYRKREKTRRCMLCGTHKTKEHFKENQFTAPNRIRCLECSPPVVSRAYVEGNSHPCPMCKQTKHSSEFYVGRRGDRLQVASRCKECNKEYERTRWAARTPEKKQQRREKTRLPAVRERRTRSKDMLYDYAFATQVMNLGHMDALAWIAGGYREVELEDLNRLRFSGAAWPDPVELDDEEIAA